MWHLHLHSRLVKWRSQCTRSLSFTMLREELRQKMHELGGIFFLHSSIHHYPISFLEDDVPFSVLVDGLKHFSMHCAVITEAHSLLNDQCQSYNSEDIFYYIILLYYTFMHVKVLVAVNHHRNVPHFRTFCRRDMEKYQWTHQQ